MGTRTQINVNMVIRTFKKRSHQIVGWACPPYFAPQKQRSRVSLLKMILHTIVNAAKTISQSAMDKEEILQLLETHRDRLDEFAVKA